MPNKNTGSNRKGAATGQSLVPGNLLYIAVKRNVLLSGWQRRMLAGYFNFWIFS